MSTAAKRHLPEPRTTLVGRQRELTELRDFLACGQLLTLTGPGGVGKTRLALRLANNVADQFEGGVFLVPLAGPRDPDQTLAAMARALDVPDIGHGATSDGLRGFLRDKHVLLLLDNFEQVIDAAPVMADLLDTAPYLSLLVTSREPLHLQGEQQYAVNPLDTCTVSQAEGSHGEPDIGPAVELFRDRARLVQPEFELGAGNLAVVAKICERLDGLPLAIELVAAHAAVLDPALILERLESRLDLLASGLRDLPPRQQTLRATIEWSYGLLTPTEQEVFEVAAVFVRGFSLDALQAVAGAIDEKSLLECVVALAEKNMLRRETNEHSRQPRFSMLETTRQYARERLAASGREDAVSDAHAACLLELAETAEARLHGREQVAWLDRLDAEHHNLQAALSWFRARKDHEGLARLGAALGCFWWLRSNNREGLAWCLETLQADGIRPELRVRLLNGAALLAAGMSDLSRARSLASEALELSEDLGGGASLALALFLRGVTRTLGSEPGAGVADMEHALEQARRAGPPWLACHAGVELAFARLRAGFEDEAKSLIAQSRSRASELADSYLIARCDHAAGYLALGRGDTPAADQFLKAALESYERIGHLWGALYARRGLGFVALEKGDFETTKTTLNDMVTTMQAFGDEGSAARAMQDLGYTGLLSGDYGQARWWFGEAMWRFQSLGHVSLVASCLESLAVLAFREGQLEQAARQFGAASARRANSGVTSLYPLYRRSYEHTLREVRNRLGSDRFRAFWNEGLSSDPDTASASASLAGRADAGISNHRHARYSQALTVREVDVLRLLAGGSHNNEIAERLIMSPFTVNNHLRSIYGKLEVHSRSAATRCALDRGLI